MTSGGSVAPPHAAMQDTQETPALWRMPESVPPELDFTGSRLLDHILFQRGVRSATDVHAFLHPTELPLGDPYLLPDMQRAVDLIQNAIERGSRIVIFGDYDVDGLTSTAMLVRVLRRLGADPLPLIPHRVYDGYGVNPQSLIRILDARPELLISVDCGSSSPDEFKRILDSGSQAIVLDHHAYSGTLPEQVAFVSPQRPENTYPTTSLAAVGVAYALVRALLGNDDAAMYLPYVSLGSIADVVDLRGENRALVARGLSKLRRWTLPGLLALCNTSGIDQHTIRAWEIGFLIGPRLNAAGRVDTPQKALDLLLAEDIQTATPLAETLTNLNDYRRRETTRIIDEAETQFAAMGGAGVNPAIVLSDASWSVGVAGLVAARLAERHCRPAIVLQDEDGTSRGSARTAGNVDLIEALSSCADILGRFGGHSAAAGLTIDSTAVPELRRRLSDAVLAMLDGHMPRREFVIDALASHADLTMRTVDLLDRLEPCGQGNPRPTLAFTNLRHRYARRTRDGAHLMFHVIDDAGTPHRAVMFGGGGRLNELTSLQRIDVVGRLERDTWQGATRLKLHAIDFRPSASTSNADSRTSTASALPL